MEGDDSLARSRVDRDTFWKARKNRETDSFEAVSIQRHSMSWKLYGIFAYMDPLNHPTFNVLKYAIHEAFGICNLSRAHSILIKSCNFFS